VTLAKIIPLSFVMIAGPRILSAISFATSENWRGNSAALVAGAAVSISAIVTAAFFLSHGASKQGASGKTLDIIFMVLLIAAGVHAFLTRKRSKPPTWMGGLEEAKSKGAFKLRFLGLASSQRTSSPRSPSAALSRGTMTPGGMCCRSCS
jgi:hypothetical protein